MQLFWEAIESEYVDEDGDKVEFYAAVYRAKVPGGWLIYISEGDEDWGASGASFYPDPSHSWDGSGMK